MWDTVGTDHVIKLDKQTIGPLADMAWSADNQRLLVGGQGRERFGEAFMVDGGASVGEITGHAKPVTSVAFRTERPFRAATASEDFKLNWFPGPPFKYEKSISDHTRFVNCVRFSPDGAKVVTVGQDKKGFVYDGKTGDKLGEFSEENGHQGGILAASWSPDGKKILTASADKTCKLWNAESLKCEVTFTFGSDVNDQQVGCLWQGNDLISVSLRGDINFLDEANPAKPKKILLGHNKNITALGVDRATGKIFSGDFGGWLVEWDAATANTASFTGPAHATQITAAAVDSGKLVTISVDDTVKVSTIATRVWGDGVALGSQPLSVTARNGSVVVGTIDSLCVIAGNSVQNKLPIKYQAAAVAFNATGTELAAGGSDNNIYLYSFEGGKLTQTAVIASHRGAITALSYSASGQLASTDTNREVKVFQGEKEITPAGAWVFHNSRIESVAWSPDGTHLATAGNDSQIIVWDTTNFDKKIICKSAHQGIVKGVEWLDATTILSAGQDMTLKAWTVKY